MPSDGQREQQKKRRSMETYGTLTAPMAAAVMANVLDSITAGFALIFNSRQQLVFTCSTATLVGAITDVDFFKVN